MSDSISTQFLAIDRTVQVHNGTGTSGFPSNMGTRYYLDERLVSSKLKIMPTTSHYYYHSYCYVFSVQKGNINGVISAAVCG